MEKLSIKNLLLPLVAFVFLGLAFPEFCCFKVFAKTSGPDVFTSQSIPSMQTTGGNSHDPHTSCWTHILDYVRRSNFSKISEVQDSLKRGAESTAIIQAILDAPSLNIVTEFLRLSWNTLSLENSVLLVLSSTVLIV